MKFLRGINANLCCSLLAVMADWISNGSTLRKVTFARLNMDVGRVRKIT